MSVAPTLTVDEAIAEHGEAAVRRGVRYAMWRRGDLRYLLHEGQLEALACIGASPARRFVTNVGRRWGKSRMHVVIANLLVVWRIMHRSGLGLPAWAFEVLPRLAEVATRTDKAARIIYAAPTEGMVAEFVEPHMQLLADHAPPELRPEQKRGDWIWPDGDRVAIKGCEDRRKADRLRGPEADLAIADEGGFIPILDYVVRSVIGPQLWETRGPLLLPSTPPESPDHPFVGFVLEAQSSGAYYHATTADAPHITDEMLAEAISDAGGEDTVDWRREGLAEILVDPTQVVIPEWTEQERVIVAEHERPSHYLPVIVGDLGYVDLTVFGFGYYDFKSDLDVIEDELVLHHTTSADIDAQVSAKARELWGDRPVHQRHVDAQPITRADMSARGMGDDEEAPGDYWQPVRKDERDAAVNAARIRVKRARIRVHPRCRTTIAHCRYGRWNARRTDFERPDGGGHHYDGLAMLVYFLRMLDRQTNPYPRLPEGVVEDDHFIHPRIYAEERRTRELFVPKSRRGRRRR